SAAYSTAIWQARGMNAITTVNHLMGELTALLVIHDALGGPTLERSREARSDESKKMDRELHKLVEDNDVLVPGRPKAPYAGYGFLTDAMVQIDDALIMRLLCNEDLSDMMLGEYRENRQFAGATLYDARLTLKYQAVFYMTHKYHANRIEF